ncbi:MAG: pilus assembly protein PilM [Oscillospiraceae bacterium]|nr:pilus assembly protein PilM [Oscillospiraceae bacterium]
MLSFDITDRNIRIIKGTESGGKIKISAAAELELDEAVIVNGHVNDPNRVAGKINQALKNANIADKEAVISISSNQTVFKELMIPPNPKESEFMKNVRIELKNQINIDDSYSVAYVIVGEPEDDEQGGKVQKILATACPQDVVDSYRRIFNMLNIQLKSVMIGCNAITKVLLADAKSKAKMPLLAVQIDANFISLNLYENNTLSFSRFASIDPEDYDHPNDYIFEAINENIYRMLQFARIRGSEEIRNVVFYGDIDAQPDLYDRIQNEQKANDIEISRLNVPPQIHGYQNLNFSLYANAIGGMFKRDKLTEHINLLETDAANAGIAGKVPQDDHSFNIIAVVGVVLAAAVVGVSFGVLAGMDTKVKSDTKRMRAELDSPETAAKLQQYDDLLVMKDTVKAYVDNITTARDAYNTQPIIKEAVYTAIEDSIAEVVSEVDGVEEDPSFSIAYAEGVLTVPVTITSTEEFTQKYPSALVQYLYDTYGEEAQEAENRFFSSVTYSGYAVSKASGENAAQNNASTVTFDLTIQMLPNELPEMEEETVAEDTAAEE